MRGHRQTGFESPDELLRPLTSVHHCAQHPDHFKDLSDAPLIERMDVSPRRLRSATMSAWRSENIRVAGWARRYPQPIARKQPPPRRVSPELSGARECKKCGSALKFGVIAAGEADLYPRFGTTMEWDTAAGQAILEAAGGRVEALAGAPLAYGKPGLKNDGFLAWGCRPVR